MKTKQEMFSAGMSLAGTITTVILASAVHFSEYGYRALIVGLVIIAVLSGLFFFQRRTSGKVPLVFYGFLSTLIVAGFGIVNGFWNHAFKVFLFYLHNGGLPPMLSKLFLTPRIGSFVFESLGIGTFITSMLAAIYTYKYIRDNVRETNHDGLD